MTSKSGIFGEWIDGEEIKITSDARRIILKDIMDNEKKVKVKKRF